MSSLLFSDVSELQPHAPLALKSPKRPAGEPSPARAYIRVDVPQDLTYARVMVAGRSMATVSNNGHVQGEAALVGRLQPWLKDEAAYRGPQLAQHRAELLAQKLGGIVMRTETALTQDAWYARPEPRWRIDHARMEQDGFRVPQDLRTTRFRSADMAEHTIRSLMEYHAMQG